MASFSSSSQQSRYQVFLSFRGEDTRHNFASHLLKALKGRGINVFFDEEKLEKGEELSPALLNAIAASKVSIVILSKDYASSKSCLTELSKIMECKLSQGQIVLPIFYHVNPSDVRHHAGSFEESFNQHLIRKPGEVERWKAAFSQVGNLKGWHIDEGMFDRSEPAYIEAIVKDVTNKLGSKSTNVSKDLVGIHHQMEHIVQLIEAENSRMIGIWGMGGIGKTTLADAVYNKVLSYSDKFDAHHFLHNVREKSVEANGSQSLRNKLLSKLLKEDIDIDTQSIGSTLIQDRLGKLRVLVVFDDVDNLDQIKHFGVEYFGLGSKIIVTSRDLQVLLNIGVDIWHKVNALSGDNSIQLFSKHAFKQDNPVAGFQDLAMKFVGYAGGTPLALKVLGAALFGKSRREWEGAWDKLEEYPEQDIFGPLKISYDGLSDLEKNIFLDIACFHRGKPKDKVEKILQCCYKGAEFGIGNLVNKCLIDDHRSWSWSWSCTYKDAVINMHDLLQEMGRDIAHQEGSRFWTPKDVCDVLKNKKGTRSIKGISLNMREIKAAVHICPSAFKKMVDLKFIQFYDGEFGYERSGKSCNKLLLSNNKLKYLPDELRYFLWNDCPLKSLPSKFSPNNLVELNVRNSNIKRLWSRDEDVVNLKELDLSGCKNLRKIPNLSGATKLEYLLCDGCRSLVELPCMTHLTSLKGLYLEGCPITKFPEIPTNGALEILNLGGTQIEEVPSLMWSLKELSYLCMRGTKIRNIPSSILKSDVLKEIYLFDCANLTELNFNPTPMEEAPSSNSYGTILDVGNCGSLKSLLGLPSVGWLTAENCTSLERVSFIGIDPGFINDSEPKSRFDFGTCSKLSQDARNNIIAAYPMIICPSQAKISAKLLAKAELDDFPHQYTKIGVICCLPKSEIPEISDKFENQNRNSSITVKLGSATSTRFLCFALCLVLEYSHESPLYPDGCDIECKYQLKGGVDGDKIFRFAFWSGYPMPDDNGCSSEQLCFLFGENMVHRDMQYTKASFAFRVSVFDGKEKKKVKVERCGVHVFYVDAESFTVSPAVSSTDFSSDGQDNDEEDIDFSSAEDTSCGEGSMVEEDIDFSSDGQDNDEEDSDFSSDEDTSNGEGSMVEEDANVQNDHYTPALTNDEGYHLDKRLNAFSIDFSSHEDMRSCSPSWLSLGLGGPMVEDAKVENDHDDPARTIQDQRLAPKRILSPNDEGDHPDKRLKRPYSS